MKTKKRKLNKLAIRRCIIVFLIIIIFLILISTIINKNKNKYKELTILLNNELLETTKEVIIEDNNIFFSKEDIKTIFDDTIYYNEAEKELITTYNTHVALLKVDEQYALINDQNVELKGKLKEINDTIYLPLTDLESVYDIDLEFSKESNRIIMDSTQKKKVEATVLKRANLENKKGLFSKKIEKLIIGDKVTVFGPGMDDYSFVIERIKDELGKNFDAARHPQEIIRVKCDKIIPKNALMRVNFLD